MKRIGEALTNIERRVEHVLANMPGVDSAHAGYTPASPAVASPSYQAVESESFAVAPDGVAATWFLRLALDEVADLVDDETAFRAAERLHGYGLSPRPIHRDRDQRAIVFERLDDRWRTAKIDDLIAPEPSSRLIDIHKTIAAGAPFGRSWSIFDGIDQLWSLLGDTRPSLPGDVEWMLAWMAPIRAAVAASGVDFRPAHGDPHSSNVMIGPNGELQLIDFDMAADIDPYYQLGVQMNELYQFENQMKPLLEMHDGDFSETAFNRCRLYAAADDLYWALRSMLLEKRSQRRGIEFLKYAGWRFLRCRMLLGRPGFEELVRSI
jgi:hypothetical protein